MRKSIILALMLCFVFIATNAWADPVVLKMGWQTPPQARIVKNGMIPWLKSIEQDSQGTVKFQQFFGGQLSRNPGKQLELMMNGVQDVTVVIPGYTQELFPDYSIFSLPYLFDGTEEAVKAMWRYYEKGLLTGLDNVYVVATLTNGNSLLHFSVDVKTEEDIKGLKIRASGPEEAGVIKAMGGIPVAMGITQIAESLNRGVIQGALTGFAPAQSFRYLPLIKTHWAEPFGMRGFFLGINKKVYDSLPQQAKAAIQKHTGLEVSLRLSNVWEEENQELIQAAKNDPKRNYIELSKSEQQKHFNQIFKPFHDQWIKDTPNGRQKYDALIEILADIRKNQ